VLADLSNEPGQSCFCPDRRGQATTPGCTTLRYFVFECREKTFNVQRRLSTAWISTAIDSNHHSSHGRIQTIQTIHFPCRRPTEFRSVIFIVVFLIRYRSTYLFTRTVKNGSSFSFATDFVVARLFRDARYSLFGNRFCISIFVN